MSILETVNHFWPDTIRRLALTQDALPEGAPFMGYYVELFDGATLPTEAEVTAKIPEYEAVQKTATLLSALATHRYAKQTGGLTVGGVSVKTDSDTLTSLIAARILAKENAQYTVKWKAEGGFVTLNAATVIAIADAVRGFIQACFDAEAAIAANVANYDSVAAITAAFDTAMEG
jgi:hypothetical protein